MKPEETPKRPGQTSVPRAYFTSSKGKRFYAVDYGYKAWPIGRSKPGKPK